MKSLKLIALLLVVGPWSFGQEKPKDYSLEYTNAYSAHPEVPLGILESMAWYHSRGVNMNPTQGCSGIPVGFGLFNLIEDGKGFFHPTANSIQKWSGESIIKMKSDAGIQILSLAASYSFLMDSLNIQNNKIEHHLLVINALSSIPTGNRALMFARQSEAFEIFRRYAETTGERVDFKMMFGKQLDVLQTSRVNLDEIDDLFKSNSGGEIAPCFDYASDIYTQTPTCNYNSRSEAVSAVTIHTIQGSYAGAIAWAQNCNANVSYHYVIRSSDGQVTQMLCESDRGWHVGTENDYAIGIEHEGYVTEPSWYTEEMYFSSSNLVKDISESGYGIDAHRTAHFPWSATTHYNVAGIPGNCNRIKGHQHFPNQTHTDPGANWDWDYFYKLIDPLAEEITITDPSGTFVDDGGLIAPYSSDLRSLTLFEPAGAAYVGLTFTEFDLEPDWDYLYIYDGWSVFDPLIGIFTGTDNPGTVVSTGESLLVEFRSDCSVAHNGWEANFQGQFPVGIESNEFEPLNAFPNPTSGLIHMPNLDDLKWEVFDLKGRSIAVGISSQMDLGSLNIGPQVLLLRMASNNKTENQRLVFCPK